MTESDFLLVERLRNKEEGAFEIVFNSFYSILCSYANKYLNDPESAEEIVQDVFVKFWEKCESLAPDSSVKSYLFRSVHNTCLNHLKHLKVRDAYKHYVVNYLEKESTYAYGIHEEPDLEQKIEVAISSLPPQCQRIFRMSRFDGLKYQEIADHIGISVKTVEVQMGKALRLLREKLKDFLKDN
ncbi:RNA polymerase sigma-70 factor [Imperialibacter roseus]|uniref:RNA polymerase sigma-70 factor n=1 Tax=Imperialibacter roseus TaxID=1324217 RepID=A0ABZ0IWB3_9BACT|nr:RNA polymerase sigma-70 factor [Imperialibacter roseus]WOK08679.1 RNA polymerase sigma-70 factor [Imperialibacter roseus]